MQKDKHKINKGLEMEQKQMNMSLLTGNMIVHVENPKATLAKNTRIGRELSKVSEYHIHCISM